MKTKLSACCLCVMFFAACTGAGWGIRSGKDATMWNEAKYSVVIGTLRDIKKWEGDDHPNRRAIFEPRATLAGTFDSSLHPTLLVSFFYRGVSSIKSIPADGATVIAVLEIDPPTKDQPTETGFITSDECLFMQDMSSLVAIKGLDDPLVSETLKMIQKARKNEKAGPEKSPTTVPTK